MHIAAACAEVKKVSSRWLHYSCDIPSSTAVAVYTCPLSWLPFWRTPKTRWICSATLPYYCLQATTMCVFKVQRKPFRYQRNVLLRYQFSLSLSRSAYPIDPLPSILLRAKVCVQTAAGVRKVHARCSRAETRPARRRFRRSCLVEGRARLHRRRYVSMIQLIVYSAITTAVLL